MSPLAAIIVTAVLVAWFFVSNRPPRRPKQTRFVYCPGCKRDLCSNPDALYTDTDLVRYLCSCGTRSEWLFDAPCPILISPKDNDGHLTDGTPCWCEPTIEHHEGGDLIIHRSKEEMH